MESGFLTMYPDSIQVQFRLFGATGHRLLLRAYDPAWLIGYGFADALAEDIDDMIIEIYAVASIITPQQGRPLLTVTHAGRPLPNQPITRQARYPPLSSFRSSSSYFLSSPQTKRGAPELSSSPLQGTPIRQSEWLGWLSDHLCAPLLGLYPSAGAANHSNHPSTTCVGSFFTSWDLSLLYGRQRIGHGGKSGPSLRRRNRTALLGSSPFSKDIAG